MVEAVERLESAARDRREARERINEIGESRLRRCRDRYEDLRELLDRYEDTATGSGDFKAFTEFQGSVATLVEDLDEDIPNRETFEAVDGYLQQRRLSKSDFDTAREKLQPVADRVAVLSELEDACERYAEARKDAQRELERVSAEIDDLERVATLGEADLDAPIERLSDPVETYNDAVRTAFEQFRSNAPARDVLAVIDRTDAFPLVEFVSPPNALLEYVRTHETGTEPIPALLEYADYSASKLSHYVDDTAALKRAVGTRRTYLRNLDADPLTVGWPPPPAEELPWRCRAYQSVLSSFAEESVIARLRDVRDLAWRSDYERLRESAIAQEQLSAEDRDRLARGTVKADLQTARENRETITTALEEYEPL
jgi:hypothetical protein